MIKNVIRTCSGTNKLTFSQLSGLIWDLGGLPYKGLMGTCGQPGYVFRDFCLEQGFEFIIFCLNQGIDLSIFVLNWVKCLKQGIKNRNSVLNRLGKSAIFVLNRVKV